MLFTILIQPSKCFREGIKRNQKCGPSGVLFKEISKEDHSIYLMGVWLHIVVYKALLTSFAYTFYILSISNICFSCFLFVIIM